MGFSSAARTCLAVIFMTVPVYGGEIDPGQRIPPELIEDYPKDNLWADYHKTGKTKVKPAIKRRPPKQTRSKQEIWNMARKHHAYVKARKRGAKAEKEMEELKEKFFNSKRARRISPRQRRAIR